MSGTRDYSISNEQLLLINILNSMYNDNIHQINLYSEYIQSLHETNTQIRNLLVELLYLQIPRQQTTRRNNFLRQSLRSSYHNNNNNNNNNNYNNTRELFFTRTTPNVTRTTSNNQLYNINDILIADIQSFAPLSRSDRRNETNRSERNTSVSQVLQNFFQPVEVYPTQTQIEAATRTVRYSDIVSPINRACPISLENFNDSDVVTVIRFCGHIFKREELSTWFRSNCRCPVCRYDIRNYNTNASSEILRNNVESRQNNEPEDEVEDENGNEDQPRTFDDSNEERNNQPNNSAYSNTNDRPTSTILFDIIIENFNDGIPDIFNPPNNTSVVSDMSGNLSSNQEALIQLLNTINRNVR
jgi:hypothetical protein